MHIPKAPKVPYISKEQMIEVDKLMINKYKIDLPHMMEQAGKHLAELTKHYIELDGGNYPKILVCAGSGGNGGGALVAARYLSQAGFEVYVVLSKDIQALKLVTQNQYKKLYELPVTFLATKTLNKKLEADFIIDGLLGYSIDGNPHGDTKKIIKYINKQNTFVISLDLPSGIDPDEGLIYSPYVQANATLTLALPKKAFLDTEIKEAIGDLFLANILVPQELYNKLNIEVPTNLFEKNNIVSL